MVTRYASVNDLPELKTLTNDVIKNMEKNNIYIWDKFYPYEKFSQDIERKMLYVICDDKNIVSVFGLFEKVDGDENFSWDKQNGKSLYLGRFAVSVNYQGNGKGKSSVLQAMKLAKNNGYKTLRLLVAVENTPAIKLYENLGFKKINGEYTFCCEDISITEIGYEKLL